MLEELQAKPQRKVAEEAKKAEQQAFDRAYRRTRKEVAKEQGAAAGAAAALADAPVSALEAARQRALGATAPEAPKPAGGQPPTQKAAAPTPSVRRIRLPDGIEVPEAYYDLDAASQKRMVELIKEREVKEKDDSAALNAVQQLLDLRDRDTARVKTLEGQLSTLLGVVEAQQRQISGLSTQIEVGKSEALLEQQAGIGQDIANISAIRAEAAGEMAEFNRQREAAAEENRAALEATATAVEALRGSVSSASTIYQEGIVANQNQLAAVDAGVRKLNVQLQELEGKTDAWTDPITRNEVTAMATDAVAQQWRDQVPAIVDAVLVELADQFPGGLGAQRHDSDHIRQLRSDAQNFTDRALGGPAQ